MLVVFWFGRSAFEVLLVGGVSRVFEYRRYGAGLSWKVWDERRIFESFV